MTFKYGGPGKLDFSSGENRELKNTVDLAFDPYQKSAQASIKRRGFGGEFMAPGVDAQTFAPLLGQKSQSLTDLFFKKEGDKRAWEEQRRVGRLSDIQYGMGKAEIKRGQQRDKEKLTVLCTELYRQGKLPLKFMKADLKYLKMYVTPEEHALYTAWAIPLTEKMRDSELISAVVLFFVYPWNVFMYRTVRGERLGFLGGLGKIINELGSIYGIIRARRLELCSHR